MKNIIKELLPYVLILGGVILIRTFIVTPVIVSGDSMKPNLHNGDLLLERKAGRRNRNKKRRREKPPIAWPNQIYVGTGITHSVITHHCSVKRNDY